MSPCMINLWSNKRSKPRTDLWGSLFIIGLTRANKLTSMPTLRPESEVTLGEYKVNFNGRNRAQVKRKALEYWFNNRDRLRMSLNDFVRHCRLSPDERTITFSGSLSGN